MDRIETSRIACAAAVPGINSLAPVLLMDDGTYRYDPSLSGPDRFLARQWVKHHGDAFKDFARDQLSG